MTYQGRPDVARQYTRKVVRNTAQARSAMTTLRYERRFQAYPAYIFPGSRTPRNLRSTIWSETALSLPIGPTDEALLLEEDIASPSHRSKKRSATVGAKKLAAAPRSSKVGNLRSFLLTGGASGR